MSFLALSAGEFKDDYKIKNLKEAIDVGNEPQLLPIKQLQNKILPNKPILSEDIHNQIAISTNEGFENTLNESTQNYGNPYVPQVEFLPRHQQEFQNNQQHQQEFQNQNQEPLIMKKLNHIIRMLEEEKDDKLESTTEDVLMFSLFGIFTIFIVDSFVRVGKYVR